MSHTCSFCTAKFAKVSHRHQHEIVKHPKALESLRNAHSFSAQKIKLSNDQVARVFAAVRDKQVESGRMVMSRREAILVQSTLKGEMSLDTFFETYRSSK